MFEKILLKVAVPMLWPLEVFRPRLYMSLYLRLLVRNGLLLTGKPRYISRRAFLDNPCMISLGDRVVISRDVSLLTHDYSITTAIGFVRNSPPATDISRHGSILIGNNVFIGLGTVVLPGVVIEDNVVVGAGSVVRGRLPSGKIYSGNPAVPIGDLQEFGHKWESRVEASGSISHWTVRRDIR